MRLLQLTNTAVGAVAVDTLLPLGAITRKYCCGTQGQNTFAVSTTGANTITINDTGYYRITYVGSLTTGAGTLVLNLLANGVAVETVTQTVVAGTNNVVLDYIVRVLPNCASVPNNAPLTIQVENDATSVAITGGTSNIIVEKL